MKKIIILFLLTTYYLLLTTYSVSAQVSPIMQQCAKKEDNPLTSRPVMCGICNDKVKKSTNACAGKFTYYNLIPYHTFEAKNCAGDFCGFDENTCTLQQPGFYNCALDEPQNYPGVSPDDACTACNIEGNCYGEDEDIQTSTGETEQLIVGPKPWVGQFTLNASCVILPFVGNDTRPADPSPIRDGESRERYIADYLDGTIFYNTTIEPASNPVPGSPLYAPVTTYNDIPPADPRYWSYFGVFHKLAPQYYIDFLKIETLERLGLGILFGNATHDITLRNSSGETAKIVSFYTGMIPFPIPFPVAPEYAPRIKPLPPSENGQIIWGEETWPKYSQALKNWEAYEGGRWARIWAYVPVATREDSPGQFNLTPQTPAAIIKRSNLPVAPSLANQLPSFLQSASNNNPSSDTSDTNPLFAAAIPFSPSQNKSTNSSTSINNPLAQNISTRVLLAQGGGQPLNIISYNAGSNSSSVNLQAVANDIIATLENNPNIDVFALQEVDEDGSQQLLQLLNPYLSTHGYNVASIGRGDPPQGYTGGLMTFTPHQIVNQQNLSISGLGFPILGTTISIDGQTYDFINLHQPRPIADSGEAWTQLLNIINGYDFVMGDFNTNPDALAAYQNLCPSCTCTRHEAGEACTTVDYILGLQTLIDQLNIANCGNVGDLTASDHSAVQTVVGGTSNNCIGALAAPPTPESPIPYEECTQDNNGSCCDPNSWCQDNKCIRAPVGKCAAPPPGGTLPPPPVPGEPMPPPAAPDGGTIPEWVDLQLPHVYRAFFSADKIRRMITPNKPDPETDRINSLPIAQRRALNETGRLICDSPNIGLCPVQDSQPWNRCRPPTGGDGRWCCGPPFTEDELEQHPEYATLYAQYLNQTSENWPNFTCLPEINDGVRSIYIPPEFAQANDNQPLSQINQTETSNLQPNQCISSIQTPTTNNQQLKPLSAKFSQTLSKLKQSTSSLSQKLTALMPKQLTTKNLLASSKLFSPQHSNQLAERILLASHEGNHNPLGDAVPGQCEPGLRLFQNINPNGSVTFGVSETLPNGCYFADMQPNIQYTLTDSSGNVTVIGGCAPGQGDAFSRQLSFNDRDDPNAQAPVQLPCQPPSNITIADGIINARIWLGGASIHDKPNCGLNAENASCECSIAPGTDEETGEPTSDVTCSSFVVPPGAPMCYPTLLGSIPSCTGTERTGHGDRLCGITTWDLIIPPTDDNFFDGNPHTTTFTYPNPGGPTWLGDGSPAPGGGGYNAVPRCGAAMGCVECNCVAPDEMECLDYDANRGGDKDEKCREYRCCGDDSDGDTDSGSGIERGDDYCKPTLTVHPSAPFCEQGKACMDKNESPLCCIQPYGDGLVAGGPRCVTGFVPSHPPVQLTYQASRQIAIKTKLPYLKAICERTSGAGKCDRSNRGADSDWGAYEAILPYRGASTPADPVPWANFHDGEASGQLCIEIIPQSGPNTLSQSIDNSRQPFFFPFLGGIQDSTAFVRECLTNAARYDPATGEVTNECMSEFFNNPYINQTAGNIDFLYGGNPNNIYQFNTQNDFGTECTGDNIGELSIFGPTCSGGGCMNDITSLTTNGVTQVSGTTSLVELGGPPPDTAAPQLNTLFSDGQARPIDSIYHVNGIQHTWDASVAGFNMTSGENILVPQSGYNIGQGCSVMVLSATANSITLKYTREDTVAYGYTLHINNINVNPEILAIYDQWNTDGRTQLPALKAGQSIGTGNGTMQVVIRDTGQYMDPRSGRDWWQAFW